jgi:hypothetical protein
MPKLHSSKDIIKVLQNGALFIFRKRAVMLNSEKPAAQHLLLLFQLVEKKSPLEHLD